jgi:hypothetical protein
LSDYSKSKDGPAIFPETAVAADYQRLEPILTPEQLVNRHLFGIPLVSQMVDPFTRKPQVMSSEMIKDIIDGALQQAEMELHIDIRPVQHDEKYPFDRNLYESFGYMQLEHRPVQSIQEVAVTPPNGLDIYQVPLEWVETAYLPMGQLNIIPLTAAFIAGGTVPTFSSGAAFFLSVFGNRWWIPSFWRVKYTSGYCDGNVPRVINELIGTIAAIEVLSQLAVTYARSQSHSLGIDGMSQSVSTPGPAIFQIRMQELEAKKKKIVGKVKALTGRKIFSSTL